MSGLPQRRWIRLMGAAGCDVHHVLRCYRDNPRTEVVAFTAAQLPQRDDAVQPGASDCRLCCAYWMQ
jgi:predicted GTPase